MEAMHGSPIEVRIPQSPPVSGQARLLPFNPLRRPTSRIDSSAKPLTLRDFAAFALAGDSQVPSPYPRLTGGRC